VRNEDVLHRVKEERNIVHTIKRRMANWIGDILRRNCLLKYVIAGKIEERREVTVRLGRGCKQLLDDLMEAKGYCKLKEEALDRTLENSLLKRLRTCRKTHYGMNEQVGCVCYVRVMALSTWFANKPFLKHKRHEKSREV
jgi:hypothetical protein